jgi:hypothetical protein
MPITLGILAQSRQAPAAASDFVLLDTQVLGTAASSVTFSSLNASYGTTYKHLQIRVVARTGRALANDPLFITMNGIGGTSYSSHAMAGNGSGFFIEGFSNSAVMDRIGNVAGANAATDAFGASVVDILDPFITTKNTTVRTLGGIANPSNPIIGLFSGAFLNTAAVTSITVSNFSATNFAVNSRFSLYGVK